jgi:hypothetical protein
MAGVLYQVNGPAVVWVAGGAVGSARVPLGICRDVVHIRINHHDNPINASTGGPQLPVDVQEMGKDANIRCSLSEFDPAVLDKLEVSGDAPDVGSLPSIGMPLAAAGKTFQLAIPSNYKPWTFYTCKLRPRDDAVGTVYSVIDLEFYAWANIGGALNAKGAKLFAHTF